MKKITLLAIALFSITPSLAYAQVPKDLFFQRFENNFVNSMCKSNSMFRTCFPHVKSTSCREFVRSQTAVCKNTLNLKIPDIVTPKSGSNIGRQIGGCVGKEFQLTFQVNPNKENSCLLRQLKLNYPNRT